ncbi:hypothetical protein NKG94_42930 [Micromonospora sp. M12]
MGERRAASLAADLRDGERREQQSDGNGEQHDGGGGRRAAGQWCEQIVEPGQRGAGSGDSVVQWCEGEHGNPRSDSGEALPGRHALDEGAGDGGIGRAAAWRYAAEG